MCEEIQDYSFCEDIQTVIALPIEVPKEGYCDSLERYVNDKEQDCEQFINQIHKEIDVITGTAEEELRQTIDVAKMELELISQEIGNTNLYKIGSHNKHGKFPSYDELYDKNIKIKARISLLIEEFNLDIKSSEERRRQQILNTLSKFKDQAISLQLLGVSYIEDIFQSEINNANKLTVEHLQWIEDIKLHLEIRGKEITNRNSDSLKDIAKDISENQSQYICQKLLEKKNKNLVFDTMFNLTEENLKAREHFYQATTRLAGSLSEFQDVLRPPDEFEFLDNFWDNWAAGLYYKLEGLELMCRNVEDILKTAIATLLESYDTKINTLTARLTRKYLSSPKGSDVDLSTELSNELEKLKQQQAEELEHIRNSWQTIIDKLSERMGETKTFIMDLTSIWNCHISRVNIVHDKLETEIENLDIEFAKIEKDENSKIKNRTKELREAKDNDNLNVQCDALAQCYDGLTVKLGDTYYSQLQIVEDVKLSAVDELIKDIQTHINKFIKDHPKEQLLNAKEDLIPAIVYSASPESFMDSEIVSCNTYIKAVDNRMMGMYEFLERYANACESIVQSDCKDWLNGFIKEIVNKYEARLEWLNKTHSETLQDVKQVRSAELSIHSERIQSHIDGCKVLMEELNQQYEEVKSNQRTKLSDFLEKLSHIDVENLPDTIREVQEITEKLQLEWSGLVTSLEDMISGAKSNCENVFDALKQSSDKFLSTAKLFKQGGNYSSEELKVLNKELKLIEKSAFDCKKDLMNKYSTLSKELTNNPLDRIIQRLKDQYDKLNLQRNLTELLDIVKMKLKAEINEMEISGRSLEGKINALGLCKTVDTTLFGDILNLLVKRHDYLNFSEGLSYLECNRKENNSPDSNRTSTQAMEYKNKKSIETTFFGSVGSTPTRDESEGFLSRVKKILTEMCATVESFNIKLLNTEKSSNSNPSSKKQELKKDGAPYEWLDIINQAKAVLYQYNLDCEVNWIYEINEFIKQITMLRSAFNSLVKSEFEHVHSSYIDDLANLEQEFKTNTMAIFTRGADERSKIQKRLLLPLAHPTHQNKLTQLIQLSRETCDSYVKEFRNFVKKYEMDLQNRHDEYAALILSMTSNQLYIQNAMFNETPFDNFSKDLDTMVKFRPILERGSEVNIEKNFRLSTQSIWSNEDKSEIQPVRFHLDRTSERPLKANIKMFQDVHKIIIRKLAAENLKYSANRIQTLYDDAIKNQNLFENESAAWLKHFNHDVNKTKKVFTGLCQ